MKHLALIVLALLAFAPAAHAAPPVQMVAPDLHGAAVNSDAVRLEAVVRAPHAVVRVDGRRVARIATVCPEQVVERRLRLDPGTHLLVVSAGRYRAGSGVVVDASMPARERNRIEEAATPSPFACLSRSSLLLQPGRELNLARDRVVLVRNGVARESSARELGLHRLGPGRYGFRSQSGAFALRVGDDWGALDAHGRRSLAQAAADLERAGAAEIGTEGGVVSTVDAAGVRVTLSVPSGALSRRTAIRIVPLRSPAVAGGHAAQQGVRFEPDGLVFAKPALLTLDYSKTEHEVGTGERVSLATSPLTALPLPGIADPAAKTVTALLPHFSQTVGGLDDAVFADLKAWADPILAATARPTLAEIASLMELLADQQAVGCTDNCIDPATVQAKASSAVSKLDSEACALDVADPTDLAFQRWLALAQVAASSGADASRALQCAGGVLRALILDAGDGLERILELLEKAQRLGLSDLEELALARLDDVFHADIVDHKGSCAADPALARQELADTRDQADLYGRSQIVREAEDAIAACNPAPAAPHPPTNHPSTPQPAPPPPVSATGCDADVANPTDAAVDRWHTVETGAAPGADISAVRTCIGDIFTALIQQASTAAADPSDTALQRFLDLSNHAALVGYPDSSTEALQALDDRLRATLAAANATCSSDAAAGRALIDRVIAWAPQVASVDAPLAAEAAAARVGCTDQPGTLDVSILSTASTRWATQIVTCSCDPRDIFHTSLEFRNMLPADATPPLTLNAPTGATSSGSMRIEHPSDDRVTVDVDLSANHDFFSGYLSLGITPSTSGTLRLAFEDGWSAALPGNGVIVVVMHDEDTSTSRRAGAGWDFSGTCGSSCAPGPTESSLDQTLSVTAGGETRIFMQVAAQSMPPVTASGRLLTITLEP